MTDNFIEKTNITPININDEMKSAYLSYAMSVIVSRALPDIRDGMKPVHRRVIFAMYEQSNTHNKPYKKSARIVGDVLGKYHPHGDTSVYDALVRLAQDFSMRYTLIDGQGNFGSIDGDSPAAMRYTEVRLSKISDALLESIHEDTVDFAANYDNSEREPTVLPTIFPQLLVNGQSGIAVGMATNIPPHNLSEILEATVAIIDNPDLPQEQLLHIVKGPDFPTQGVICGRQGIRDAYLTGRGSIVVRGKATVETLKNQKECIIITELPYQVNKSVWIEKLVELVKKEEVVGISDIRDESNKEGIRIVIELKKGEMGEIILNHIYKRTRLQDTFSVNMVCIVRGIPKLVNLMECLVQFRDHRYEVIVRRTRFRLRKATERAHLLEGMKVAVENVTEVIALIRAAQSPDVAKTQLIEKFSLSPTQAQAILELRLSRLTAMEREKIVEEHKQILLTIDDLKNILVTPARVSAIAKEELLKLKADYGDARKTEIVADAFEVPMEQLIAPAEVFVTFSTGGYIKRVLEEEFRSQHRAGKGKTGVSLKESDVIKLTFRAHTHDHVLMFSNLGKVYCFRVFELPEASAVSRGQSIAQLLTLGQGEKITTMINVREFTDNQYLFMTTERGVVKKTDLALFSNIRSTGIKAIVLDDGDHLISVMQTNGDNAVVLATIMGKVIHFSEKTVRSMGRTARGVNGISLDEGDRVVGTEVVTLNQRLLVVTELGYGKRSEPNEYRITSRAGKGVNGIRISEKNGKVAALLSVPDDSDVMLTTSSGRVLRTPVKSIPVIGRVTQGVCLMRIKDKGEKVVSVSKPNEFDSTPVGEVESTEIID